MTKTLKRKWLAALRSGKYGQVQGFLNMGDGRYCCLGVLCEVAGVARAAGQSLATDNPTIYDFEPFPSSTFPSAPFLEKVKLDQDAAHHLAAMNDGQPFTDELTGKRFDYEKPMSFAGIARWIEKNL